MRPLIALLLLSSGAWAAGPDLPMGAEAWQGMSRGTADYRDRYHPVNSDADVARRLWRRLAREGLPFETPEGESAKAFERAVEPDAGGAAANRLVYLVQVPQPEEGPLSLAVHRETYSHLVASSEDWSRSPDGRRRVEIWRFVVGLEGTLFSATRQEITLKDAAAGARGQSEADESRSRHVRLRPGDPAVQKRWKELSAELLRLGPVTSL